MRTWRVLSTWFRGWHGIWGAARSCSGFGQGFQAGDWLSTASPWPRGLVLVQGTVARCEARRRPLGEDAPWDAGEETREAQG